MSEVVARTLSSGDDICVADPLLTSGTIVVAPDWVAIETAEMLTGAVDGTEVTGAVFCGTLDVAAGGEEATLPTSCRDVGSVGVAATGATWDTSTTFALETAPVGGAPTGSAGVACELEGTETASADKACSLLAAPGVSEVTGTVFVFDGARTEGVLELVALPAGVPAVLVRMSTGVDGSWDGLPGSSATVFVELAAVILSGLRGLLSSSLASSALSSSKSHLPDISRSNAVL